MSVEHRNSIYTNPPAILTGGEVYPPDYISSLGMNSNEKNFNVARFAEVLLLYAEACIGSADASKGLAALNRVQERSGSGKISSELTFDAVMEEKQYEMWFENCRFHDLVRWDKYGKIPSVADVFNNGAALKAVPVLYDEYFVEGKPGYKKEHKLYTGTSTLPANFKFEAGKHEYWPFPLDVTNLNPGLTNYGAWGK